jgi:hypothetical protein
MKKFSKLLIALIVILNIIPQSLLADEGMWLISLIHKNIAQMQKMGLTLTADDIYSINQSSLKDAVVQLDDGGCSAELISPLGLVLTNHHCAIGDIQYHSTSERNLIKDGFWAADFKEELHVPGKTALILKRVEDVTQRVLSSVDWNNADFFENTAIVMDEIARDIEKRERGTHALVVPMYNHNQFFLFVYNRFTDVRLVGAPPSSIGNFGGDVDNWRWPRHTGDFSLYRIYTAPDGSPANYNKRNKPYKPKFHFSVSLEGVNEGDFAMVLGYPGTTYRHSSSFHASHERDIVAPWVDNVWGEFIGSIKNAMQDDPELKVQYTDTHDMLVNFWQKDTYQAQSMNRFNVVNRMTSRENELKEWVNESPDVRMQHIDALENMKSYYDLIGKNKFDELFRSLSALVSWPVGVGDKVYELYPLFELMYAEKPSKRKIKGESRKLQKRLSEIFKNYNSVIDQQLYSSALVSLVKNLPSEVNDPILLELSNQEYVEFFIPLIIEQFYANSFLTSQKRFESFLKNPSIDSLSNDPLFMLHISYESLIAEVQDTINPQRVKLRFASRDFAKGLIEMNENSLHYPDANSTMRLSYGRVSGYYPRDGVYHKFSTYLDGKIEKENPSVDIFMIPPKIKSLWKSKDYGRYADERGLPICFLTDNDITNGNSGSPVLNAKGHLIGVAFDGNYEAMACDFMYEYNMQRTIVTDIRYVLFVIDKFAGAKRLINEMTIIE